MSDLARLQAGFQSAVLRGNDAFEREILSTERVDAGRRIGIYSEAYRLRLIEVLQENFPGLLALLGTDRFDPLARRYVEATPSPFRSARWYGDGFADFLVRHIDTSSRALLVEMARTDWVMGLAFDAADAESITPDELATVPAERWGDLVFDFHPSVQRLDLAYDTPPIRSQLIAGETIDSPSPRDAPRGWTFWRASLRVHYRSLDIDEAFVLDAAREGASFAELCAAIVEWVDEQNAPMRAVELLKQWLVDGMITHFRLSGA